METTDLAKPRDLVRLPEAARRLSVPLGTLKSWVHRKEFAEAGIDREGHKVYDLAVIRRLAETTKRRKRRRK